MPAGQYPLGQLFKLEGGRRARGPRLDRTPSKIMGVTLLEKPLRQPS